MLTAGTGSEEEGSHYAVSMSPQEMKTQGCQIPFFSREAGNLDFHTKPLIFKFWFFFFFLMYGPNECISRPSGG